MASFGSSLVIGILTFYIRCAYVNGQGSATWGQCSKTCGQGTKMKEYSNGTVVYDDCFVGDCPQESCADPFEPRYSVNKHSCCHSVNMPTCGVSSNHGRVISGRQSREQQWPWMVHTRLQVLLPGSQLRCGGILISDVWVLTAAHCFHLIPVGWIRIKLGALLLNDSNAFVQSRRVNRSIIHEQYNSVSLLNDIALLQLDRPVEISSYVRPICLPQGKEALSDSMCVATGWGVQKLGTNAAAYTLMEADVRILPKGFCNQAEMPWNKPFVEKSNICAGAIRGGVDTCKGDSGGPLMCQRCSNCAWYAVGITSFGLNCGQANRPGVYTNVSAYESWIKLHSGVGEQAKYSSCEGAPWKPWNDCSKTCGTGFQTRTRSCGTSCTEYSGQQCHQAIDCSCTGPSCACKDLIRADVCQYFRNQCRQSPYYAYLKINCKKSCGECDPDGPAWSAWEPWTSCSVTCGAGTKWRYRGCNKVAGCGSEYFQTEPCNDGICLIFTPWTEWTSCTVTCETGVQSRSRTCTIGTLCEGDYLDFQSCNVRACPYWSSWSLWSNCDVTCGPGKQRRNRNCVNGSGCPGSSSNTKDCAAEDCPEFNAWSNWSTCDKTCGPGKRRRTRTCSIGTLCVGDYSQTSNCNLRECPGGWTNWSEWNACVGPCGWTNIGTTTRSRACIGASACLGESRMYGSCFVPCPPAWGSWGRCSRTCGNGTRTKRDCSTCKVTYDDCFERECPRQTCQTGFRRRYSVNSHACCDGRSPGSCGISNPQGREFPWVVQIEHTSNGGSQSCLGMLISTSWVLTAGHCVANTTLSAMEARFGTYVIGGNTLQVQIRRISRAEIHPKYDFPLYDISVIQLITPVVLGDFVKPICLPWGEKVTNDIMCVAPTLGLYNKRLLVPTELKMIDLRILDFAACKQTHDRPTFIHPETIHVCAGTIRGGPDTCYGDGGGPLMCQRCSSCEWFAAGITSFGPAKCGAPNKPGIYTRISYFESWVKNITGVDGPNQHNNCV